VEKATNALRLLGYATARVSLCERLVPREWACLVSTSTVDGRASWVHFHRVDDGTFVVRARREGALAPRRRPFRRPGPPARQRTRLPACYGTPFDPKDRAPAGLSGLQGTVTSDADRRWDSPLPRPRSLTRPRTGANRSRPRCSGPVADGGCGKERGPSPPRAPLVIRGIDYLPEPRVRGADPGRADMTGRRDIDRAWQDGVLLTVPPGPDRPAPLTDSCAVRDRPDHVRSDRRMRSASPEWRRRPSPRATATASARRSPASTHSRWARVTAV
jgi:hypothetical protein